MISQLLESLTTSVTFSFQHKTVAESHGSWKVQLPSFLHLETISLGPSPQEFWIDGPKPPWDVPSGSTEGGRGSACFPLQFPPSDFLFFYPAQKSILGLTTSHTQTLFSVRQASKVRNECRCARRSDGERAEMHFSQLMVWFIQPSTWVILVYTP